MLHKVARLRLVIAGLVTIAMVVAGSVTLAGSAGAASKNVKDKKGAVSKSVKLKKGLKIFVIPKELGNSYFTTADSVKTGGALAALKQLGEKGQQTASTTGTPSGQLPIIQTDISKGAKALIISATSATALCPTLKAAMKRGVKVITYDSDAPGCRTLFVDQASAKALGESEVQIMASEIHDSGEIGIVSATASDTNQNTWISWMKVELKKYPKITLEPIAYGNTTTATSVSVTEGLLSHYPNLKGIISPTTTGIAAAGSVLDAAQYRGKVMLTGLGTPNGMRSYVKDGTVKEFELWDPAKLGYLAAYAAVEIASGAISNAKGQKFTAGKLGKYTVGADHTVLLGPPFVFTKKNIDTFNF